MDHIIRETKTLSGLFDEETNNRAPSLDHLLTQKNTVSKSEISRMENELASPRDKTFSSLPYHSPNNIHSPQASPLASQLFPTSPESTWCKSPSRTPLQSPLHYRCISSLRHHGNIYSIAVSKGLVFTGSNSSNIRAWQLLDCSEKGYIKASTGKVEAMLAHKDMLFTSHKDHKIRIWSLVGCDNAKFNPRKITTLPSSNPLKLLLSRSGTRQHKDTVSCMAYHHDDGVLYTGSWDKTVKAWRLSDGKCVDSFVAHANNINDMVINQDGFLFTCSSDGTIKMWSRVCGETFHTLTMTLSFHNFPIYALSLSEVTCTTIPHKSFLYSGSSDGCINLWVQQFSDRYSHGGSIQAHQFAVLCLTTLDNLVISGSEDATIKIWRRSEGKVYHDCLVVLEGHKGPVKCIASCLEKDNNVTGFLVFSASSDLTFKFWRVKVLPGMKMSKIEYGNVDEIALHEKKRNSVDKCIEEDNIIVEETYKQFCLSPAISPAWVVKRKLHDGGSSVIG